MKKHLIVAALVVAVCAGFTSCGEDDEGSSSLLIGTWQSVGYYNSLVNGHYFPETTEEPIPDTSEKITFKSNGKGVYITKSGEREFDWKRYDIGIDISIAPSIHNDDNWDVEREYYLSSTELAIIWSNKAQYVYRKIQ